MMIRVLSIDNLTLLVLVTHACFKTLNHYTGLYNDLAVRIYLYQWWPVLDMTLLHTFLLRKYFHFDEMSITGFTGNGVIQQYSFRSCQNSDVSFHGNHYNDVIMSATASQINSLTIVYSTVYSMCRSKKTSKLRITGLCTGNSPVIDEFPAQRVSNASMLLVSMRMNTWSAARFIGISPAFWMTPINHRKHISQKRRATYI